MDTNLMRKWLWMKAMEYAIEEVKGKHRWHLFPTAKYHEWKHDKEIERTILTYALDNWENPTFSGQGSGHTRYHIGLNVNLDSKGATAEYRDMKVEISINQIKAFIRELLDVQPEDDQQLTMFELLARKTEDL